LYDVGPDYLVMEYIEGKPVSGPMPLSEALKLAVEIAEALDTAHGKGIVHRDLKPDNILVTKSGVKLLDFGLAKVAERPAASDETVTRALTQEGTIVGTLQYMSPEQLQGEETDARSDIFSFGAVLYEMLTGHRAFAGKSQASIITAHHVGRPAADLRERRRPGGATGAGARGAPLPRQGSGWPVAIGAGPSRRAKVDRRRDPPVSSMASPTSCSRCPSHRRIGGTAMCRHRTGRSSWP
jgi:serine/threonine protein kinase